MSELENNTIRGLGLTWEDIMSTIHAYADTSNPPELEEYWNSLKEYIAYYLERGWRFC